MTRLHRREFLAALGATLVVAPTADAAPARTAYRRVWRSWTRKLVVYRGFGTALFLRVTLLEPEFRERLADERHRLMGPADAGDAAFRERMAADGAAWHEIVFAAHSGEEDDPRFGNDDGRWNLELAVDGADAPLVNVEHIRRPTPVHRGLYPQLDIWSELWMARFQRTAARPTVIELRFGSGLGNGEVRWARSD